MVFKNIKHTKQDHKTEKNVNEILLLLFAQQVLQIIGRAQQKGRSLPITNHILFHVCDLAGR